MAKRLNRTKCFSQEVVAAHHSKGVRPVISCGPIGDLSLNDEPFISLTNVLLVDLSDARRRLIGNAGSQLKPNPSARDANRDSYDSVN
jgi:hypothetical protein